ncbi:MAG: O-antigen ligase domain-containing protein, partial [Planctomycetota bacterium]
MSWTVPVALYGWIPLVVIAFATLSPLRAVLLSYFAGWMFLPVASIEALGFFDYSKSTAIPLTVFISIVAFDGQSLSRLRMSWLDLPIAVFCCVPLFTSLSNGLGWYDGVSASLYQSIIWGLPYLTGRLYFASPESAKELALAMLGAGVVYAPLCLWEIRMSPQLHATIYGFHQHEWVQTLRGGGFRPMVFMQHGLMVGLWMCAASVVGIALWMSGELRRFWGIPMALLVPALIATTVWCKSFGAVGLLLVGGLCLWTMRTWRISLPMLALVCIPAVYVSARVSGNWAGGEIVQSVARISEQRAASLEFRISAEERLRVRAAEKPL